MMLSDPQDLLIDGLLVSKWGRPTFTAMHIAGMAAASCTCAVWEGFHATARNLAWWQTAFRDHADLIAQVEDSDDIPRLHEQGRTGVILSFQNTSPFEGDIENVEVFWRLGVRVVQLTYNFQNDVASGCYEPNDGGLSMFGREVVRELNRAGILIDLSHVGERSSHEAIRLSSQPLAITHAAPRVLREHKRNKSDELMLAVSQAGGVVGVTPLSWFIPGGEHATIDDYLNALEYTVELVGTDHVGIGTDFTEGHGREFVEWSVRHRGTGRALLEVSPDLTQFPMPKGLTRIADLRNLGERMRERGWTEELVRKVLAENWSRVFKVVWSARET